MAPPNPYEFTRQDYNELVRKIPHPVVSQRSAYEEIELVEDCTLYDLYRQPREPVADPAATRTLLVRVLNAELTCPICLGIIRNTEVVMECLHRFCGDCIQRCLRVAKKECPSCRMHIPSKRSLRRDPNFDALIAKIYPNLDEFNSQEEKLIAELNRERHFNNARTQSTKMGVQNQQTLRRNGGKKLTDDDEATPPRPSAPDAAAAPSNGHHASNKRPASWADVATANGSAAAAVDDAAARKKARTASMSSDTSTSTTATMRSATSEAAAAAIDDDDDKVNFRVLLHPQEGSDAPKLSRSLFKTSYKLKVRHLKKHLISLLKLESFENMHIVLPAKNCAKSGLSTTAGADVKGDDKARIRKDLEFDQELEDYVTLYDIYQQYGRGTKWELELYYHFSDTIVNGVAQFIASGV